MTETLRETVGEGTGRYEQVWHCDVPDMGATYRVLRQEWDEIDGERPVRHIYEIDLVTH